MTKYCGDKCSKQAYKARKRAEKIKSSNQETRQVIEKPILDLQTKDFLSIQEVCQLFKVGRTTIWR
ncbi:MAG: DNA-binding protein, partial [Saprospiraceae bacterium]